MNNLIDEKIANEKLMILYIIKRSNFTISFNNLSNLILEYDLMNYFEFVEYFGELKSYNFIVDSKEAELKLTEFALQTLDLLESKIDKNSKTTIDEIFSKDSSPKNLKEFQLIPLDNGKYIVNLTIASGLDEHFSISFTVNNLSEAKSFEKSWYNKNKSLYREIINIIKEA